ncbi:autotransporter outer membrane beta-barrel domain-containing protein [Microvirga sp. BT689]|uniref:autotransporter family protein n=1 Tax=Microvirga arvi TaxID=2778731 RepID=UPI0019513A8B|nr:autotransporter outer membrane beta-barrel domain-containing protein [Microvirga arvi]MBM6582312.1 autotransporter outer membrane beta-barrel domain-containing protein [Microvirga arvi]
MIHSNRSARNLSLRLLLLTLTATTSLCTLNRAAADCVLTSGPGTVAAPESGARVTCPATGGDQDTSVTAVAGSRDVQIAIQSEATFTSPLPFVTIRTDSRIENAATLSSSVGGSMFLVDGSGNTVVNTGTLARDVRGQLIQVSRGSGNTIRNDGFIRADAIDSYGIQVVASNNATIINNGEITSRPLTGGGIGIMIFGATGQSTLTINHGLIDSLRAYAFGATSGNDRLENFGVLRSASTFAAANLGSGNDTYVVGGSSSFNTFIDAGPDTDTLAFGVDAGRLDVSQIESTAGAYRNFERLEKIGGFDWTLTGTNNDALPLRVSEGRLFVDGIMVNSATTVASGGTLGGTGTVGSLDVAAGGTVAPGGSTAPGVLTASAATLAADSRFHVRVNGQGESDRLQVNGTATINGGAVSVDVSRGYVLNTPYRILTANTLADGRFQSSTASLALLQAVLSYDATNVYVSLQRTTQEPQDPQDPQDPPDNPDDPDEPNPPVITLDQVGRTWNQISTGRAIESQGLRGPLLATVLAQPTIPEVLLALDLLSGEAYASAVGVAAADADTIHRTLLARLRSAGGTPVPAAPAGPLAYAPTSAFPAAPASARSLGVDLWGQVFGTWGHQGGRQDLGVAAIDTSTGGLILGAETAFDTAWRIGMAGAYTHTSFDVTGRLSSGSIDSYHAALYGSGAVGGFSLRGGATYARHEIDVSRSATFTGFSDRARGSLSPDSAGLFAEVGYPIRFGRLTAEPIANLSYLHTNSGSFVEEGGAMALNGTTRGFDTISSTLGVRLSGNLSGDGRLTGYSFLGWQHAFGDRLPMTVNGFIAGGDPFLIVGTPHDRDNLIVETGLDWAVTASATLGLRYDGQIGERDHSQSIRGQFTARF